MMVIYFVAFKTLCPDFFRNKSEWINNSSHRQESIAQIVQLPNTQVNEYGGRGGEA
jgi:hypothetical protein